MKFWIVFLMMMNGLTGLSQTIEDDICKCITDNYKSVELDDFELYRELEESLMKDGIITEDFGSRIDKIEEYVNLGIIQSIRSYENIDFERMNLKILKFCIDLHNIKQQWDSIHPALRMFHEQGQVVLETYESKNFEYLQKQSARILLRYLDQDKGNSRLWNMITLSYLYLLTDTKLMREIESFIGFEEIRPLDTLNSIDVFINSENEIRIDNQLVKLEDVCGSIRLRILEGNSIYFQSERGTSYQTYLDVYNSMKNCYSRVRNEMAIEVFDKKFDDLNEKEKQLVTEKYPIEIMESEPKK